MEFGAERREIARIALDKDFFWEYRLACELLRDRIKKLDSKYADLESGFVVRRTRFLAGRDTINFIQDLLRNLTNSIQAISRILEQQLTPAFGPPGVSGDAIKIKKACDNLYSIFLSLYEWELDVRFVRPHDVFEQLFPRMYGWTNEMLAEFRRIPVELDRLLSNPELTGQHSINLVIKAPQGLVLFNEEFSKMSKDPRVLATVMGNG